MNAALLSPVPAWARWALLLAACGCIFLLGQLRGERRAGEAHIAYVGKQANQAVKVAKAQIQVLVRTETKYRDRVQKIYVKGDEIEKQVPVYVSAADSRTYGVNAGFVRSYDAAWTNEPAGPASDTDREPAAVSLTDIAEADAHNARSCFAWREQALGLREAYVGLQAVMNGGQVKDVPE
ncbi:hypothetical protein RBA41_28390 [Massilia sp. CCM 9210]|uniref:hypothetical protein n=1 Tax=Massilia scottii TaxID=3057166 RepID=UPI002796C0D3|nr:hypothetical protein [Massilia sp. CCM 9210]MDQ1817230.1 hypothetical protein [Massilia sp. CCM 9210]